MTESKRLEVHDYYIKKIVDLILFIRPPPTMGWRCFLSPRTLDVKQEIVTPHQRNTRRQDNNISKNTKNQI